MLMLQMKLQQGSSRGCCCAGAAAKLRPPCCRRRVKTMASCFPAALQLFSASFIQPVTSLFAFQRDSRSFASTCMSKACKQVRRQMRWHYRQGLWLTRFCLMMDVAGECPRVLLLMRSMRWWRCALGKCESHCRCRNDSWRLWKRRVPVQKRMMLAPCEAE